MTLAVFDTVVVLQAILNEGGPADECLRHVFDETVRLITSDAILDEIEDVISRPKLISKYSQLSTPRPSALIEKLRSVAFVVAQPGSMFSFERDRNDEMFLNLALFYRVEFLVTRDRDLLDLRDDMDFTSRYSLLKIVDPIEFLQVVRNT